MMPFKISDKCDACIWRSHTSARFPLSLLSLLSGTDSLTFLRDIPSSELNARGLLSPIGISTSSESEDHNDSAVVRGMQVAERQSGIALWRAATAKSDVTLKAPVHRISLYATRSGITSCVLRATLSPHGPKAGGQDAGAVTLNSRLIPDHEHCLLC